MANLDSCKECHGQDFGGGIGDSCNQCHADAGYPSWASNCTFCHGTAVKNYTPADLHKAAPAGAHTGHVDGGTYYAGLGTCTECHGAVPTDLAHVNGTVAIAFGATATQGGTLATGYTAPTCSNVYCHGGTGKSISWTTGTVACGDCHATPPVDSTTAYRHNWHLVDNDFPTVSGCLPCHKDYSETTVSKGVHVNGVAQAVLPDGTSIVGWDCVTCHDKLGVGP
jgi:predicted CxxxxCH...CXXCH cytochrome family protein